MLSVRELVRTGQLRIPPKGERPRPLFEVIAELLRPTRVAKLRQRLRLDLPDALAGDAELLADLLERARMAVDEPEPELDDFLLALRQGVQHALQLLLEQDEARCVNRHDCIGVLDEIAEL